MSRDSGESGGRGIRRGEIQESSRPARPLSGSAPCRRLFVYGTSVRGGACAELLSGRRDVAFLGPARCRGTLYDLGESAALVREGRTWVAGELYRCPKIDEILAVLDALVEAAPYERTVAKVRWRHGETEAWIYWFTGSVEGAALIPGGSYKARRRRPRGRGGKA